MTKFGVVAVGVLMPALVLLSTPAHAVQTAPLDKLVWMIGAWDFDDSQIDGDYRETGSRVCEYGLDEQYIVCESKGVSSSGKERTYLFFINYNQLDERFEMTCLFGNFPRKFLYALDVSDDGREIRLTNHVWLADGLSTENPATITYNGADRYVWNNRGAEPDPVTGEHPVTFRDVVTRKR